MANGNNEAPGTPPWGPNRDLPESDSQPRPLTHGGLFEGYGGTTMAAETILGPLERRWCSDIKPASVALLAARHPDVPNLGDLTTVDWAQVEPVDVLTASWPCQPFSSAGRRLGEEDPRALWPHVARAVATLRPRMFLGENVARIAGNGELRRAARTLADLGYVGAWRCVTAASVGAPHKRDRCFLVGLRGDTAADTLGVELRDQRGWSGGAHRQGPGVAGHDGAEGSARLTLLPTPTQNMTTGTGTGTSGRDGGMNLQTAVDALLPTPTVRDGRRGAGWGDQPGRPPSETVHRLLPTPCVGDSRNTRNATARRSEGQEHHHAGSTLCDIVHPTAHTDWREYEPAIRRWETILGRPAPSLRAPHGPQLSPRFVEWMMGLPDGWVTDIPGLTRNQQLSLLGDGVVPQQGAHAFAACLHDLAANEVAA